MKKSLRLIFGCGVLTASFGLIGCDSGGGDQGLPADTNSEVAKSVSDQMKKMGTMAPPPKGGVPKIGKDLPADAPAPDAAK